jgi:phosphate transport system permease protein
VGAAPARDAPASEDVPRTIHSTRSNADLAFRILLYACSAILLVIITAIAGYLFIRSWSALRYSGLHFITSELWQPTLAHPSYGILGGLVGSLTIAVIALVLALPISIATALMINEYSPLRIRGSLIALVDLLAALPSLIYGLWGLEWLMPHITGTTVWLNQYASFIPILRAPDGVFGNSIFICGIVVAVMILPIVTSVSREVMSQVPRAGCEAALALGGTRWGMVTDVILPFSRNGIVGGALLGLGRAMGETIAILLILSPTNLITGHLLGPGGATIAEMIATYFTSAPPQEESALALAGLTLFTTTLLVNLVARGIVARNAPREAL